MKPSFENGYALVDGVKMHAENHDHFHIPHELLKKYIVAGFYVELRVDSPRFSVHPDAPDQCPCSICKGDASKPIISHHHPRSLVDLPKNEIPSRGWGEDFWVAVIARHGNRFTGRIDNELYESRLHGLSFNDTLEFQADHILAVHPFHRHDLVRSMKPAEVKVFAAWLGEQQR